MTTHYCDRRKIDPTRGALLGDGTLNDNDRVEIGPTQLAFGEWAAAGLALPNLERMREFRWNRLVTSLQARDYGGILNLDQLLFGQFIQLGQRILRTFRGLKFPYSECRHDFCYFLSESE